LGYVAKTFFGLGILVACITGIAYAVAELLQVGTCASGGPYEVARECPSGTERLVLAFFPGSLILIIAAFVYAKRGAPPGSSTPGDGAVAFLILWSGLFLGIAFACFWAVWGPEANPGPGGETGGLIVGFLFVPMGLAPLIPWVMSRPWRRDPDSGRGPLRIGTSGDARAAMQMMGATIRRKEPGPSSAPGGTGSGGGDKLERLERLDRLRRDGAITQLEFERLKQEIV
jgi:hypothetical protein